MDLLHEPIERKDCPLCGAVGHSVYKGLTDQLYGAPGRWGFRSCQDQGCGLIWLDPLPHIEDLISAYRNYYTHDKPSDSLRGVEPIPGGWFGRRYIAKHFGYPPVSQRPLHGFLAATVALFPRLQANIRHYIGHLRFEPGGSLLEIGCGNGDFLIGMRDLGWRVAGVETDSQSAAIARKRGLDVHHGMLEDVSLSEGTYSAIVMNHVIEHLMDPVATLKACYDLLCPGGQITITTPNPNGLGHRLFRSGWRGLEPPRHVQLFRPASAKLCLAKAGFEESAIQATAHWADGILRQSVLLRFPTWRSNLAGKALAAGVGGVLAQFEISTAGISQFGGEEWLIRAQRPN